MEDLHLTVTTEEPQPQGPPTQQPPQPQQLPALVSQPQVQPSTLLYHNSAPREELHLIAVTQDTEEPGPSLSSPQRPPEPQLAGITLLPLDPERKGPLSLEPPSCTLAKTDAPDKLEVRGHPTLKVSMDEEPAEEGATA